MEKIDGWTQVTNLTNFVNTRYSLGWKNTEGRLLLIHSSAIKGGGWNVFFPLEKVENFKTKPEAIRYAIKFMKEYWKVR